MLNPPGKAHYTRDCLHSNITKSDYYWHQLDLLLQSGWLAQVGETEVLDAVVERLPFQAALRRACAKSHDYVLMMTGERSMDEDRRFAAALAEHHPDVKIFASGDVVFFRGEKPFSEYRNLRGVITDFTADGLKRYIAGERGPLPGLRYLADDGTLQTDRPAEKTTSYPRPRHESFPLERYRLPFGRSIPFGSVLTTFGCPYPCRYCNARMVRFRTRPVLDVIEEMSWLWQHGLRKLYIRDPTFGVRPDEALAICREMVREGLVFEWNAFTRPDILDDQLLEAMASSGCVLVQLGLETPDLDALRAQGKRFVESSIRDTIERCHALGIEVCGHFMIGFPGEDRSTWEHIADYAIDVGCDYFALNVAEVRLGTSLTNEDPVTTLERRRYFFDESELRAQIPRLNRRFYARPGFVLKQLRGVSDTRQLWSLARKGIGVLAPWATSP